MNVLLELCFGQAKYLWRAWCWMHVMVEEVRGLVPFIIFGRKYCLLGAVLNGKFWPWELSRQCNVIYEQMVQGLFMNLSGDSCLILIKLVFLEEKSNSSVWTNVPYLTSLNPCFNLVDPPLLVLSLIPSRGLCLSGITVVSSPQLFVLLWYRPTAILGCHRMLRSFNFEYQFVVYGISEYIVGFSSSSKI